MATLKHYCTLLFSCLLSPKKRPIYLRFSGCFPGEPGSASACLVFILRFSRREPLATFLTGWAQCPSCHPTNSVKWSTDPSQWPDFILSSFATRLMMEEALFHLCQLSETSVFTPLTSVIAEDCPTKWKLRGIVMLAFNDCCSLYMNSCRSGHCPLLQGRLRWVHYWMNWMESLLLLVHMVWWFAVCFWQSKFWLTSHLFNSLCDRNTDWLRTLSLAIIVYLHFVFNTWEQKIQAALFVLITFHFGWFAAVEKNRPRMNEMETNDALLELHFLERIILEMKTVVVWTVFVWIVRAVIFTIKCSLHWPCVLL